uniref:Ig-like domain-containing protein n=1 Tax=Leptobrachium leishanense TaxID=445787 RepID=A0A8C5QCH2_9ANUR
MEFDDSINLVNRLTKFQCTEYPDSLWTLLLWVPVSKVKVKVISPVIPDMEAGVRRILLVLCVVVLLLTGFTAEVNVPPIHRAIAGSDTLIPCTFSSVKLPVDPTFLVVSWYFEGKKILSYDANLSTLDFRFILDTVKAINGDASLSVKRVTIPDSGVYRCSIRYKTEQTEKNITFYVHAPPEIEITKKIVVMNEESILSSSITGFYPMSIDIKWFREKTVLENVQSPRPWSNPDGTFSVNSSVTITPTEEDKNQTFSCSVQHDSGPLRKDFQLEYGAIPSIEIVSSEFFLNKEQSLICRVYGFNPSSIIVEWFLDGTSIKTTKTRRIDISAVDSVYHFTPTEENWGLELSCRVQHQTLSAPLVRKLLVDGKVLAIRRRIGMFVSLGLILPLCGIIVFYIKGKKKAGNNEEQDEVDGIKDPQRASALS